MTRRTESTPRPTAMAIHYEDVLVPIHPAMGLYLLNLIRRDLESLPGLASVDWLEEITSFALFLRDLLPEEFRIPIPAVPASAVPMDGVRSVA